MQIEIRLLGRFLARRGGEEIPPGAFRQRLVRRLIRILITRRGEFVSRDVLTEALWPGREPADAPANLRVLVNVARRALGDPTLIVTGASGYSFAADERCAVDAELVLARVEAGRARLSAGQAAGALTEFRAALALWVGDPLAEDAYEDWAQEYRARLARAHLDALEGGAEAALRLRDPGHAAALAELAVAREPLRETAQLLLAKALAASGDTAAALAALDRYRRQLADELGLDPSSEATEMQTRILRGKPLGPAVRRPGVIVPPVQSQELAFVGRDREMESILVALSLQTPGTAVVSGPAGMGKSRLLAEVSTRSAVPVLSARGFAPDSEEPWSLGQSLLREALELDPDAAAAIPARAAQALVAILPELEDLRAIGNAVHDAESMRALAMEGAVRLIEAATPGGGLVLVDDLQWADATSLAMLGQLTRRLGGLGLVLAYRPEEIPAVGLAFVKDLPNTADVVHISLAPLSPEAVLGIVSDEGLARVIAEETDGTPLAIREVIRDLARQGEIDRDPRGTWRARMPQATALARELARAGHRRAIQDRVNRQSAGRRQTLCLLSLLRRQTPARLLALASHRDQSRVLDDLDALARAGLVALGDVGWATAHDLIGESIVQGLALPERARLHHSLVEALTGDDADPAELAVHLEGMGDPEAAATAFAQGARRQLERHAAEEAERLAVAGLALSSKPAVRSTLFEMRAQAREHQGNLVGAADDLRAALGGRPPGPERSRLLTRVAMLMSGSEDFLRAGELVEVALTEAGSSAAARAEALAVGSILDINTDQLERAQIRAEEALVLFTEIGDARGVAGVMDAEALNSFFRADFRKAVDIFGRVASLYRDSGQLLRIREPLVYRGWALMAIGRPEEGLCDIDEALEVERTLGRPEGEAFCLWGRSEVLAALGRVEEAKSDAETAIAIARRIGHREWTGAGLIALADAHDMAGDLDAADAAYREVLELRIASRGVV